MCSKEGFNINIDSYLLHDDTGIYVEVVTAIGAEINLGKLNGGQYTVNATIHNTSPSFPFMNSLWGTTKTFSVTPVPEPSTPCLLIFAA